jgi:hypothetical protein
MEHSRIRVAHCGIGKQQGLLRVLVSPVDNQVLLEQTERGFRDLPSEWLPFPEIPIPRNWGSSHRSASACSLKTSTSDDRQNSASIAAGMTFPGSAVTPSRTRLLFRESRRGKA